MIQLTELYFAVLPSSTKCFTNRFPISLGRMSCHVMSAVAPEAERSLSKSSGPAAGRQSHKLGLRTHIQRLLDSLCADVVATL